MKDITAQVIRNGFNQIRVQFRHIIGPKELDFYR